MNKQTKRMNGIIDFLKTKNGASTKELSLLFNVSEMTIRRDVNILSSHGLVSNLHGGVVIAPDVDLSLCPYNIDHATTSHQIEKSKIGELATTLLAPNDVIIIDIGSTTEALAKHLPNNIPLSVICNTQNILKQLLPKLNIKKIFPGGFYHPDTQLFESPQGLDLINHIRASKVFMSAAGVHESMGITCVNDYEIPSKLAIMKSSLEKILLVDSSKFSIIQPAYFADLNQFDVIVTDSGISPEWEDIIKTMGITLHIAK